MQMQERSLMTIRAVLADDQERARSASRQLISKESDMEVVGEAENGQEAVDKVLELAPDVVVMDISMPVLNGLQATAKLSDVDGESQILILSIHDDPRYVARAMQMGASGYVCKSDMSEKLAEGVRALARGEQYFSCT
jgi:DNA-binding NarL/FixJ family response regulator